MKKIILVLITFLSLSTVINAQEPYYNGVDLTKSGLELKDELSTKTINSHTNSLSYTPGVWEASKVTDKNPTNAAEVLLIYGYSASGTTARTSNINNNGGGSGEWNREHTYAKALGNPNLGTSGPGADAHHLRPSDVAFNSQRGSKKFATGSGNAGDSNGGWYPGDEWKGDIARMMMYMYIRYGNQCLPTNVGNGSDTSTPDKMIDLFLEWNAEDPVSDFERQRNTYHGNTNETYAQGNRNPFIDNAYLATRIWGGTPAHDSWGIYTSSDNEAPTTPTNVTLSNITLTTIDASWMASTDNVAVTRYEVFANGTLKGEVTATSFTVTGLNSNTAYAITVLAKDIANNKSAQSTPANATTLSDSTPPTVPSNVTISNIGGTSFKVNWSASTDNASVTGYEVYINGALNGSTSNTSFNVTNLTVSTTYSITVLAKDSANNKSAQSNTINATTTDGSNNVVELFFSEYVEGSGFNKAIEIANLSDDAINLSIYSVKRQSKGTWEAPLNLSGSVSAGDVYVIINSDTTDPTLLAEKDLSIPNVTPMTYNGDDRVGLFKNGVLIDIIGDLDGTSEFAKDVTLRRKLTVTSPNTTYTVAEWDRLDRNVVDGIGVHSTSTANIDDSFFKSLKMYPNPTTGNKVYFNTTEDITVNIYNVIGKLIRSTEITEDENSIDISKMSKGIYLVKINAGNKNISKKLLIE